MTTLPMPCDSTPEGRRDCLAYVAEPSPKSRTLDPSGRSGVCQHCGYVVDLVQARLAGAVATMWVHLYPPGCAYGVTAECTPWRTLSVTQPDVDWPVPLPPHRGGWTPAHFPTLTWKPAPPLGAHR